jgi:hypothetical protein
MLQAGRSWVPFPMKSLDFSTDLILLAALWPWGRLPLTEMSTRNLPGGKGRPASKADNLTAICESIVENMWEPRRSVTGIALPFTSTVYLYHKKKRIDTSNEVGLDVNLCDSLVTRIQGKIVTYR